ncbi:hypothetical protein HDU76_002862 [Blyttiomyces sp. JEL0837]|nr:hypothetical protein HDU76_002862 [Blyttiomyces sp. JEL0837]
MRLASWSPSLASSTSSSESAAASCPSSYASTLLPSDVDVIGDTEGSNLWPDSFKRFVRLCRTLPLPREGGRERLVQELESKVKKLDRRQLQGMGPKKQHEVEIMAALINDLADREGITCVMDLGAGQGYLDSVLSFQYDKVVIGVDDDEVQTCGAKRRSEALLRNLYKPKSVAERGGKGVKGQMYHINRRVDASESFASLLAEVRKAVQEEDDSERRKKKLKSEGDEPRNDGPDMVLENGSGVSVNDDKDRFLNARWLLCGLHTCGDLAVSAIRHFLTSDASVLVSVGCCYNKLTEATDGLQTPAWHAEHEHTTETPHPLTISPANETAEPTGTTILPQNFGYPLSTYLRTITTPTSPNPLSRIPLGFTARTLACQATIRWSTQQNSRENFTRHHYRALLQYVLYKQNLLEKARQATQSPSPEQDVIIGRLRPNVFTNGFKHYAKIALGRLNIDCNVEGITDEILEGYERDFAHREKEIAIVWTLRSMLGSAIESLLLVDRFLYLVEQGGGNGGDDVHVGPGEGGFGQSEIGKGANLEVQLFPLFDPIDSPRNMVLVARKLNNTQ